MVSVLHELSCFLNYKLNITYTLVKTEIRHTHTHTHKAFSRCSFHKANTLTMVLNACCSCCCMSRPQAAHSPWQSLRPGVKRHASSTTRYHRGIFIAQHSQTEEGQTGEKRRGEVSERRVTSRRNGGRGRQHLQGPGCSLQGGSRQWCMPHQYQFTGIISWIWAVSQSVGVGNEFSRRQERKNACVGWRESTTGGNEGEKWAYVCGQETAAAGRRGGRLMKISLQKWLKNRFLMMKAFVSVLE